jgi:hypothetical protein
MMPMATAPGVYATFDEHEIDWLSLGEENLDWEVCPLSIGPTWNKDPSWTGPRDPDGYILPVYTLGWQAIAWIEANLLADETGPDDKPLPFQLTNEQARFILWFYALDPGDDDREPTGRFLYRELVLQRLKGWGKDPLAAVISAVEFVGPCRFAGWAMEDMPEINVHKGDPVGKPHPRAWVQIAAVSLEQTNNTMLMFQGLFSPACIAEHSIDLGKQTIYAYGGKKQIKAVTSNPAALEGNRPTLVIKNETHHWKDGVDGGIAMADAIERNATKAKGGAARTLSITNAYEPSQDSVARRERHAYDLLAAGAYDGMDMMYDSLEAPKDARIRPRFPDEADGAERRGVPIIDDDLKHKLTRRYLTRVLECVRGDAWWLDIPSLVSSILNPKNKASRSRRFWFNQITANEDAWVRPEAVEAAVSHLAREARLMAGSSGRDQLEAGWLVAPDEPIVMFGDGSKSDDSTALVGCSLVTGYTFLIGVWQKPHGERGKTWLAPRPAVDDRVKTAFERFNVVAFWFDPSHAKDETDDASYWMPMLDKWMRDYKDELDKLYWPIKSGPARHAINFDMTGAPNQKLFVAGAGQFLEDIETVNDIEEFAPVFEIDGHPVLVAHLQNAVQHFSVNGWGQSLAKEAPDSPNKIDAAVCAVGARMLARIVLNLKEDEEEEQPGEIW